MCGIVGYLGKRKPVPIIVNSLRTLEYRGYDSSGVAYLNGTNTFHIFKASGKLSNLEDVLPLEMYDRNGKPEAVGAAGSLSIGIGHIRWATHGAPTDENAHPHQSQNGDIVVVHNGIIENFAEIKQLLLEKGIAFASETDTECVAHLLQLFDDPEQPFIRTLLKVIPKLQGAYALSIIHRRYPGRLFAVRNHAPLVVGRNIESGQETEYFVASDAVAFAQDANAVLYMKDRQLAELSPAEVQLYDFDGNILDTHFETLQMGPLQIDKKGYKHFMMKEIHEQPDVVRNSLSGRLLGSKEPIHLLPMDHPKAEQLKMVLKQIKRLLIVGCGTSFNAGLVGKYFIEELVRVPTQVEAAGEFRYRNPILDDETLVIAISQSGETADTLEAIRMSQRMGAKTLVMTNREDSTMARECDLVLNVRAGVEVSVCATKSFTAQVVVLYLLGLVLGEVRESVHPELLEGIKADLIRIPTLIEAALSDPEPIQQLAKQYGHARDILFIARGINYPVALEGALKLKEISYIHAEGYSGSELKHGPIAMLDDSIPVVSVLVQGPLFEKMLSNCQEAKARDAKVLAFTDEVSLAQKSNSFEAVLPVPHVRELLSPLLTTVPLQLLAYYMAEHLGKDVDQPRNLAKSVTVE